jgi:hypothetical protein
LAVVASVFLSGCASIVSDNDWNTYLQTDPEKAHCQLNGRDFSRTVDTPSNITLPSSAAPLTVTCQADGYKPEAQTLDTSIDGWIFGNVLIGGLIGVAVDAVRDAGEKYPPQMTVVLEPNSFPTAEVRDAWYERRRRLLESTNGNAVPASQQCTDTDTSGCAVKTVVQPVNNEPTVKEPLAKPQETLRPSALIEVPPKPRRVYRGG